MHARGFEKVPVRYRPNAAKVKGHSSRATALARTWYTVWGSGSDSIVVLAIQVTCVRV